MPMPITAFLLAFALGVAFMPLIIRLSHKRAWYDSVDHRKIHTGAVPRLGGVGISLTFFITVLLMLLLPDFFGTHISFTLPGLLFFVGIFLVHAVGVVDDFRNLPALLKLVVQVFAAGLVALAGVEISGFLIPFTTLWLDFGSLSLPLTIFWVISISNAINLIDGMDGLAGTVSLVASLVFAGIHGLTGNILGMSLGLAVAGGLLGFLVFNKPKAKLFMGDGGAYFLGMILATLPFVPANFLDAGFTEGLFRSMQVFVAPTLAQGAYPPVDVTVVAVVLLIPIADMLAAILRRLRKGIPLHTPDREHVHHKLLDFKFSVRSILALVLGFSLVFGACAVSAVLARLNPASENALGNGMAIGTAVILAVILFSILHVKNQKRLK